jgi:SPX domain protein involved in polyphosphate accumulation
VPLKQPLSPFSQSLSHSHQHCSLIHYLLIIVIIILINNINNDDYDSADETSRVLSMTAPPQTNAQGNDTSKVPITEESFLQLIESEMAKVERFTVTKVTNLRQLISETEALLKVTTSTTSATNSTSTSSTSNGNGTPAWDADAVDGKANTIADEFLRLEKYVNINFMGFHKILKKHDKNLPNNPCKVFYVNRLHAQAWVRGDYSDIVVRLSNIYSALRDDHVAEENKDVAQSFLRSTTKYWVKTEDVSRVKYAILRHLPVFLQKASTGETDSQFTNSVYLDNDQLELYHGRLDKTPGAIALRLRWYGPGDPNLVFVERKTHNEKWTGEISVKERFVVRTVYRVSYRVSYLLDVLSYIYLHWCGYSRVE